MMKFKELLGRIRAWWDKREEEMQKWKEGDPESYYVYMNNYLGNPPYL